LTQKAPVDGGAVALNHVSVVAHDLEDSLRFYVDVLGLEVIPTPNFGFPVQWLRVGDRQVHLFERPGEAPSHAHLALEIDDFMGVYRRAKELGVLDGETFGNPIYELPDGAVQMYLRDPAGNLVELDHRDGSSIPRHEVAEYMRLADRVPQADDAERATLFLPADRGSAEQLSDSDDS
jgi:catechol 2,3-dioxygenase-like lactoylglutathione lyase family enzyme